MMFFHFIRRNCFSPENYPFSQKHQFFFLLVGLYLIVLCLKFFCLSLGICFLFIHFPQSDVLNVIGFTILSSHHQDGFESKTPDDKLFQYLATVYASNHGNMSQGNLCPWDNFPGGITNGAYWYDVEGKFRPLLYCTL